MKAREELLARALGADDRLVSAVLAFVETAAADVDRALAVFAAARDAMAATAPAQLPREEREVWEASGARFHETAPALDAARRAAAFVDLVARSLDDVGAARRLGVDRTRLSQRLRERSLLSFRGLDGERRFPAWQFDVPATALREVLRMLDPDLHPLTVDRWAHAPDPDLEVDGERRSPVEWLTTGGDPARVASLAAGR